MMNSLDQREFDPVIINGKPKLRCRICGARISAVSASRHLLNHDLKIHRSLRKWKGGKR